MRVAQRVCLALARLPAAVEAPHRLDRPRVACFPHARDERTGSSSKECPSSGDTLRISGTSGEVVTRAHDNAMSRWGQGWALLEADAVELQNGVRRPQNALVKLNVEV